MFTLCSLSVNSERQDTDTFSRYFLYALLSFHQSGDCFYPGEIIEYGRMEDLCLLAGENIEFLILVKKENKEKA